MVKYEQPPPKLTFHLAQLVIVIICISWKLLVSDNFFFYKFNFKTITITLI